MDHALRWERPGMGIPFEHKGEWDWEAREYTSAICPFGLAMTASTRRLHKR